MTNWTICRSGNMVAMPDVRAGAGIANGTKNDDPYSSANPTTECLQIDSRAGWFYRCAETHEWKGSPCQKCPHKTGGVPLPEVDRVGDDRPEAPRRDRE